MGGAAPWSARGKDCQHIPGRADPPVRGKPSGAAAARGCRAGAAERHRVKTNQTEREAGPFGGDGAELWREYMRHGGATRKRTDRSGQPPGFSPGKRIKRSGFGTNRAASEAVLSGGDGAKRWRRGFVVPTRRSGPGWNRQPERARFSPAGDGASWPRARFSCGAEERPRGRTMDRSGRRWGFSSGSEPTGAVFSAKAGLCLSGATMGAAPGFGHEAAVPALWSTSPGLRLSTPWRTNRVAPCSVAIAVDGQEKGPLTRPSATLSHNGARENIFRPPPPSPSPLKGAGMKGQTLFGRQLGAADVVFGGQAVVFPIIVCYIREGQRHDSFEIGRNASKFVYSILMRVKGIEANWPAALNGGKETRSVASGPVAGLRRNAEGVGEEGFPSPAPIFIIPL